MTTRPCDKLLEYAYGELAGDAKAQFTAHLSTCATCPAELAAIARTRGAAKSALRADETPRLTGALHAALMDEAATGSSDVARARGKRRDWFAAVARHPGYAAAASLLFIGGTVALMGHLGSLDLRQLPVEPAARQLESQAISPPPAPAAVANAPTSNPEVPKAAASHVVSLGALSSTSSAKSATRDKKMAPREYAKGRASDNDEGATSDAVIAEREPAKRQESPPAPVMQAKPAVAAGGASAAAAFASPPPAAAPAAESQVASAQSTRAKTSGQCVQGDEASVSARLTFIHCLHQTGADAAARRELERLKPHLSATDYAEEDRLLRAARP